MKTTPLSIATLMSLLPLQPAMAQDLSSEISPATVWFALLVVLFALLVAVGIFMARDAEEESIEPSPKNKPSQASRVRHKTALRHGNRRNQQEFS